jgi:CxxH/CxxC protein (TIGR04129 family)
MYACEEHIDFVMEDFIDQYNVAPTLELIKATDDKPCVWCKQHAVYSLILEEEMEETPVAD